MSLILGEYHSGDKGMAIISYDDFEGHHIGHEIDAEFTRLGVGDLGDGGLESSGPFWDLGGSPILEKKPESLDPIKAVVFIRSSDAMWRCWAAPLLAHLKTIESGTYYRSIWKEIALFEVAYKDADDRLSRQVGAENQPNAAQMSALIA
jgi:hypothetical protein